MRLLTVALLAVAFGGAQVVCADVELGLKKDSLSFQSGGGDKGGKGDKGGPAKDGGGDKGGGGGNRDGKKGGPA